MAQLISYLYISIDLFFYFHYSCLHGPLTVTQPLFRLVSFLFLKVIEIQIMFHYLINLFRWFKYCVILNLQI